MSQKSDKPLEPKIRRAADKQKKAENQTVKTDSTSTKTAATASTNANTDVETKPATTQGNSQQGVSQQGNQSSGKPKGPKVVNRVKETRNASKEAHHKSHGHKRVDHQAHSKAHHSPQQNVSAEDLANFMTFETGTSEDFAALLSGETRQPEKRRYRIGDEVSGTILTIGNEYIYVDLGASYEGTAPTEDFINENGELPFEIGDKVKFFVVDLRGGSIGLGLKLNTTGPAIDALEQAYASGLPVEGRVTSANKGGYVVTVGDVDTFCPISQIELSFTEDPTVHVGQTYEFKVTDIREEGRNIIVSRSALLLEQEKEARRKILAELKVGDRVTGVVTKITDFGAFVDIGGVEGLLHISEIGYEHIDHPKEVLKEGDKLDLELLSIEEKKGRLKISLSRKSCLTDPWEAVQEKFKIGTEINGVVVRTEAFGAFVEIAPGLEGLVHVSEMSWAKRINHANDIVADGDKILVRVMEIDPQRRRISLSMKSLEADPWQDVETTLTVGQEVTGTVERVEDFGAFIRLDKPDVTALLPRSEMNLNRNETPYSKAAKGSTLTARILDIDLERRRIAVSLKSADEIEETKETRKGPRKDESYRETTSGSGLGTFGDLLRNHLKKS